MNIKCIVMKSTNIGLDASRYLALYSCLERRQQMLYVLKMLVYDKV
jgi:hypothetical protein